MLRLLHLPFWRRSPLGWLLPALGVGLGVATIVAVELGGASAVASFRVAVESMEGRATHQVVGAHVPADLARRLARSPGVESAAPAVETLARIVPPHGSLATAASSEPLRILGIDPLAEAGVRSLGIQEALGDARSAAGPEDRRLFLELLGRPGALLVSGAFLDRHGLRVGDDLSLIVGAERRRVFVLARLPERAGGRDVPDDLAVGDLATVQELTGRFAGVERIDLLLSQGARATALARVRALLPAGLRLERAGGRAATFERALAAFRTNLRALSLSALLVAFFLIYDSVLLAVLRRRPLIGVVRCLGATRGQVLRGWLLEALLIGAAGAAFGVALGLLFATPALRAVSRTAVDLYGAAGRADLALRPSTLLAAAGLGIAFTVLSALFPALEAAATPPARTSARPLVERAGRRSRRLGVVAAVALAAIGCAALAWPTPSPVAGYVTALCLVVAAAFLVPTWLDLTLRGLLSSGALGGGVLRLAAANLRANLSRAGVAAAALTVALSLSVGMGTLVGSFRRDLVQVIEATVRADIYLSPATLEVSREGAVLPPGLARRIAEFPGVAAVDTYRAVPVRVAARETLLAAVDVPVLRERTRWPLLDGGSAEEFFDALERGGAGVSEALHRKTGIRRGERIAISTAGETDSVTVAGVYRDYSSERGVILVDRTAFSPLVDLGPPRSLSIYLEPGVDAATAVDELRREFGRGLALVFRSNRELRERALAIFERTFSITRVMELAAVTVAAIGILGALLAMLLERGREIATLRALGLTRSQLAGMLLAESTLLALTAAAFALATGAVLAWVLLEVVNVRSFGWALDYSVPWGHWAAAVAAAVAAAWLATLWPARRAGRMALAPLLREE